MRWAGFRPGRAPYLGPVQFEQAQEAWAYQRVLVSLGNLVFAYLAQEANVIPAGVLDVAEEGLRVIASRFGYGHNYLQRSKASAQSRFHLGA